MREGDFWIGRSLIGIVRPHTHRVRIISGADRWSIESSGEGEKDGWEGKKREEEANVRRKNIGGQTRQLGVIDKKSMKKRGLRIFSIYLGIGRLVCQTRMSGI